MQRRNVKNKQTKKKVTTTNGWFWKSIQQMVMERKKKIYSYRSSRVCANTNTKEWLGIAMRLCRSYIRWIVSMVGRWWMYRYIFVFVCVHECTTSMYTICILPGAVEPSSRHQSIIIRMRNYMKMARRLRDSHIFATEVWENPYDDDVHSAVWWCSTPI